jgi:hypothetical protein
VPMRQQMEALCFPFRKGKGTVPTDSSIPQT